jgi:hypothetical protein
MFHPWRALRGMDLTVEKRDEPGLLGSWCERTRTLRYGTTLNQAERRCTAAHEGIHAERGDTQCHLSVHREAARRLISVEALAEAALFHGDDLPALAEALWVDEDTLTTRINSLHPAERGYLRRRLAQREEVA